MKSLFRVIFCVVLMACSMHVFAAVEIVNKTLYCKVSSTSKFPISKSLEVEYYEAGKVLVEEHSTSSGILFSNIVKYKSLEPREALVNKCSKKIGYLTEDQVTALDFYVWKRSYSYTSTYGYFKLEIDDGTNKESIKVSTKLPDSITPLQNMITNEYKKLVTKDDDNISTSSGTPNSKDNVNISKFSIKEVRKILETPLNQFNMSKYEVTLYESMYMDDGVIMDDINDKRRVDSFLNCSIDVSEFLEDYKENVDTKIIIRGDGGDDVYVGEVKDNKIPHGKGVLYYANGDIYEGDFKDAKRDGKGVLYFINDRKYVGDFKNDKYHGEGIMIYPDNSKYEGSFEKGKKHGKAIVTYPDGSKYEGRCVILSA